MKLLKNIKKDLSPLSSKQTLVLYIIIACFFQFIFFYAPNLVDDVMKKANAQTENILIANAKNLLDNDLIVKNEVLVKEDSDSQKEKMNLPKHEDKPIKVIRTSSHVMTAYNSDPRQTDSTPCITANGFNVCEHGEEDTIAANFLRFGTKVMIPELFGDRVFIVRDRMNKRYTQRVDIWMKNHSDAINFGVRVAEIQVIE
jgi:3D (Asp-Asp-Asp) domain-containing protein